MREKQTSRETSRAPAPLRKLRKLRRDPGGFFVDMVHKRFPEEFHRRDPREFNLELFTRLNEEYRSKPIVPEPPKYDAATLKARGAGRIKALDDIHPLSGARILEIGCGTGETVRSIAQNYPDAEVVGIDVRERQHWHDAAEPNLTIRKLDVTQEDYSHLGRFHFIYSYTVWEHVEHPYSALRAAWELLEDGGKMFMTVNLYRGTHASHLYRSVYFPWPHLLFSDDVFEAYYRSIGQVPTRPAWVNKLTGEQYEKYFEELGFEIEDLRYRMTPFDDRFYKRFEHKLKTYPVRDLKREYLNAIVVKPARGAGGGQAA